MYDSTSLNRASSILLKWFLKWFISKKAEYRKVTLLQSNNVLFNRDAKKLADAGYYDTGDDDVRCFSCGEGIGEYSENDFPWEWHAKSSPYCRHVLKEGSAYFQAEYIDIRTNRSQVYGENVMLKEMALCKVCCDETSSILFLPCLHLCVCLQCSYNVSACPSCGEHISQRSQYKLDI